MFTIARIIAMVHLAQPFLNQEMRVDLRRAKESSERYVGAARSPQAPPPSQLPSLLRRLNDEECLEIVEGYEAGASQLQLAVRFGVHRTTIMRLLEREEVRARRKVRKLTAVQVDEIAQLYRSGLTLAKIAAEFSVGPSTVRRELVKAGVTLRHRGRS